MSSVPASTLYTFKAHAARESDPRRPGKLRALVLQPAGRALALAATIEPRAGIEEIIWFPPSEADAAEVAALRVSSLEQLYGFVLRQSPLANYRFVSGIAVKSAAPMPHEAVLREIAKLRECAVDGLSMRDARNAPMRWGIARISRVRTRTGDAKLVGARVRDSAGSPVAQAQLSFVYGEHLGCSAQTGTDGVGSCRLYDAHGHADHEEVDASHPLVVTFGGLATPGLLLLPSTARLRAR